MDLLEQNVETEVMDVSLLHSKANECRNKIETAVKNISVAFYDLAIGLEEAARNDYPKIWGYSDLGAYADMSLGIGQRMAYYMVSIGKAIRAAGLTRERVEAIGWTKLRAVSKLITANPSEADEILSLAEETSSRELDEIVKHKKATPAKPDLFRLSTKFDGEAARIVTDALDIAYEEIGSQDVSQAINYICSTWLLAKRAVPEHTMLSDWIQWLEKTYHVKLSRVEEQDAIDILLDSKDLMLDEDDVIAKDSNLLKGSSLFEDDSLDKLLGLDTN